MWQAFVAALFAMFWSGGLWGQVLPPPVPSPTPSAPGTGPYVANGGTTAISAANRSGLYLYVQDFGAKCDGVTDDTSAFNAAISAQGSSGVVIPGVCKVSGSVAFTGPVTFGQGGQLACGASNVTFKSALTAPRQQIFASGCTPSFSGDLELITAFPEWWGAVGDASGAPGVGADNTTALQAMLNSGVTNVSPAPNAKYRFSTLTYSGSWLTIAGSRDSSAFIQDDATGLLNGLILTGNGQNTIKDVEFWRAQAGVGSVAQAFAVAGGSGYLPGDTIKPAGGTYTTQALLTIATTQVSAATIANGGSGGANGTQTVTGTTGTGAKFQANVTVSGGAIAAVNYISLGGAYTVNPTTLSAEPVTGAGLSGATLSISMGAGTLTVTTAGAYTAPALPLQTPNLQPAVAQASSSGSGTGATVKLVWTGPALININGEYQVVIDGVYFYNGLQWDAISMTGGGNSYYIRNSQIGYSEHSAIYMYGPTSGAQLTDIFISANNYIRNSGFAGVDIFGYVGGLYLHDNVIFNNNYGVYADANNMSNANSGNKIRSNDIDTNNAGLFFGEGSSYIIQNNWIVEQGPFVCTGCTTVQASANMFQTQGGTGPSVVLNGVWSMSFQSETFNGSSSAVLINPNGPTQSQYVDISGMWHGGSGAFLTSTGSTTDVTLNVQLDANETLLSGTIANLEVFGSSQYGNNSISNVAAKSLWGAGNSTSGQFTAMGGSNNAMAGAYASTAFGNNNSGYGTFTHLRGYRANDFGRFGGLIQANGMFASSGDAQAAKNVLWGTGSSTSAIRLTSDGAAAGSHDCFNIPTNTGYSLRITVQAFDHTTPANAETWPSWQVMLTRGSGNAVVTAQSAPTPLTTGTVTGSSIAVSADTTNQCLNLSFTPPTSNTDKWNVVATVESVETF